MRSSLFQTVLDGVYPRSCSVCGVSLQQTESSGLCWDCRTSTSLITPPWCDCCGMPVAGRLDHAFICADCQEDPPPFTHARSICRYEGGVRDAIHALKYQRDFSVVPDLARMLLAGIRTHVEPAPHSVLVPVPLHWRRRFHRGFNQGAELIRGMRKQEPSLLTWNGLKRVKHTDTQTRLSKAGRKANVKNAFQVNITREVPERVLLLDDVMTTGATLSEAARALKKAGVKEVNTLTLARG